MFVMDNTTTLQKSYRATKNADSSGHHLNCSVSWLHAPESHSQLTNFLRTSLLVSVLQAQLFVWSSRHWHHRSKVPKIRSLLWLPIYEHKQRLTHTHTHTLMLIIMPQVIVRSSIGLELTLYLGYWALFYILFITHTHTHTECVAEIPLILNCDLCDAAELREVVMVVLFS